MGAAHPVCRAFFFTLWEMGFGSQIRHSA
jgi:hypothetical protein